MDLTPYRRNHPPLGAAHTPCTHCERQLDAREPVLILTDEAERLRLYCVRPECAEAFATALPAG